MRDLSKSGSHELRLDIRDVSEVSVSLISDLFSGVNQHIIVQPGPGYEQDILQREKGLPGDVRHVGQDIEKYHPSPLLIDDPLDDDFGLLDDTELMEAVKAYGPPQKEPKSPYPPELIKSKPELKYDHEPEPNQFDRGLQPARIIQPFDEKSVNFAEVPHTPTCLTTQRAEVRNSRLNACLEQAPPPTRNAILPFYQPKPELMKVMIPADMKTRKFIQKNMGKYRCTTVAPLQGPVLRHVKINVIRPSYHETVQAASFPVKGYILMLDGYLLL